MAIVNSAATFFGEGAQLLQRTGVSLSGTGAQNNTVPSSGSISPTVSRGLIRAKISAGGGTSPTLVDLTITCTDGTNTVTLDQFHPSAAIALSSTASVDYMTEFLTDIAATSLTFSTTLGGTSPTASGDFEVVATP